MPVPNPPAPSPPPLLLAALLEPVGRVSEECMKHDGSGMRCENVTAYMSNDACSCSQTRTGKMPIPKAEKAADRLLQKVEDATIESKTFVDSDYRKIATKVR